ncbi:hypothetical protein [Edaphobacillus lindanitolerans]|uniref:Uncharacterized protein n=1 Tax=Edaphobacillus lindanitolerans TaxID=550447 RepID=A0A1U7PP82_9BACI|nr:hypothetical protein [Edaphobacillus lindanitolerans]SIT75993.1 hypothetical protein SAMN05428946_1212 [Edaphobacillus lindanitolerans]
MNRNKAMLAAVGLGAAYLMRNKDSRDKLKKQFDNFSGTQGNTPKRQSQMDNGKSNQSGKKGGLLTSIFD